MPAEPRSGADHQMSEPQPIPAPAPSLFRRLLPVLVLVGVAALVFAMGWHRHLTIESIAANRDRLQEFIRDHWAVALAAYVAIYASAVAVSVPGSLVMTLTGGLLFGWLVAGTATVVAATIGATVVFLVARSAFGETLAAKAGPSLAKLRDGFKRNALSYLLFLRLVPAFPFFLVNIAPALLGVPLRTYVLGTFFGIIPGTFAFASAGAGLDGVIASAKAEYAACVAEKGAAACKLTISLSNLINTETKIAFVLLGVVALIPVLLKNRSNRHANA